MQPQSFNTPNNNKRTSGRLVRSLLIILVIAIVYCAGFFTPKVLNYKKYTQAESVAQDFIQKLTAGDYASAIEMGDNDFKEQYPNEDALKETTGDVKSDNIEVTDTSSFKVDDFYLYRQVVDGLPENPAGLTDGMFEVTVLRVEGEWKVSTVKVL